MYAQLIRLIESADRKVMYYKELVADQARGVKLVNGELECAYNDMVWTTKEKDKLESMVLRGYKKHSVINRNVRNSKYASRVVAGDLLERDDQIVEVTGLVVVSDKTVLIQGRYLDNGAAYSERKRSNTFLLTQSRSNIKYA